MNKNIISLENIAVSFDGEKILNDINLDIKDKEFVTFLGPSGCGKTTTLRIIGGFLKSDSGIVRFDGKEINNIPPYKRNVNTVFQRYALFPHLNVYDNIAFGLKIKKFSDKEISFINSEEYNIKNLKNGVISEIPMGIISNNVLLSNIGPKIPVKLNLIGNVVSSVETTVKNYGINSALIEIYAKVEVTEEVIIPFQTERIKIVNNIPVAIKIINGKVPDYYRDGKLSTSSNILSIPIETD